MNREEWLKEEINDLEIFFAVTNLLQDKKELETLREDKMKGQIVRSHLKRLQHGEEPGNYFCFFGKQQFPEKTIKCIKKKMAQLSIHK